MKGGTCLIRRARARLENRRFLVLGLGRAGRAVSRFLLSAGARVFGYDDRTAALEAGPVRRLRAQGLEVWDESRMRLSPEAVIVSPGFPDGHPLFQRFEEEMVPLVDELDFASEFLPARFVAVTGTNGKSTTTALVAAMLQADKKRVFLGGNIAPGEPLSAALFLGERDFYCVEVSSFQLERATRFAPRVAVILNVSPDHLDRHRSFEDYLECKAKILDRQEDGDWAVLNYDDPLVRGLAGRGRAKKVFFSVRKRLDGGYLNGGWITFRGERVCPVRKLKLIGAHNVENALAATCAAKVLGCGTGAIVRTLESFSGLKYRLEVVRKVQGVVYVNNSMCTNPRAGVRSLEAVSTGKTSICHRRRGAERRRVVLIAGGREKGGESSEWSRGSREYVRAMVRRAKWVILLGENSESLARQLADYGFERFEIARSMREAVRDARRIARAGDVVLFSPGFASFDMFRNFIQRGRAFENEVRKMAQGE